MQLATWAKNCLELSRNSKLNQVRVYMICSYLDILRPLIFTCTSWNRESTTGIRTQFWWVLTYMYCILLLCIYCHFTFAHSNCSTPPLRSPWCWSCSPHSCNNHQLIPNFRLGWPWVQAHHTPGLPASWCWPVSTRHQGQCSWTLPVSWQSPVGQRCLLGAFLSPGSIPTAADGWDTALCQDDQLNQALICENTLLPGESALHIQAAWKTWLVHIRAQWITEGERIQWTGCDRKGCGKRVHCQLILLWPPRAA